MKSIFPGLAGVLVVGGLAVILLSSARAGQYDIPNTAGGVTVLANGNDVVSSPDWDEGLMANVGAATWGNGTEGVSGVVSFAPDNAGEKSAGLRVASNDANENPHEINLSGREVFATEDSDGDSLNDAAETQLAELEFEFGVPDDAAFFRLEAKCMEGRWSRCEAGPTKSLDG